MDVKLSLLKKAYPLDLMWRLLIAPYILLDIFLWIVMLLAAIQTIGNYALIGWLTVFGIFILALGFLTYLPLMAWGQRLELSVEGICYYQAGLRVYTPWQNVAEVARVRILPERSVYTIILKRVPTPTHSFKKDKCLGQTIIQKRWWVMNMEAVPYYSGYIPLNGIAISKSELEKGIFYRFVQSYAPHVSINTSARPPLPIIFRA